MAQLNLNDNVYYELYKFKNELILHRNGKSLSWSDAIILLLHNTDYSKAKKESETYVTTRIAFRKKQNGR